MQIWHQACLFLVSAPGQPTSTAVAHDRPNSCTRVLLNSSSPSCILSNRRAWAWQGVKLMDPTKDRNRHGSHLCSPFTELLLLTRTSHQSTAVPLFPSCLFMYIVVIPCLYGLTHPNPNSPGWSLPGVAIAVSALAQTR